MELSGLKLGRALAAFAFVLPLVSPAAVSAQQTINAQALTAEGLALSTTDLGPEWSASKHNTYMVEGSDVYTVTYAAPSGRAVRITTAVASSADLAEVVISSLRYDLEQEGATIVSVQNQGFGDGRAFKGQFTARHTTLVAYLFRVHNLFAQVDYVGADEAADLQSQALLVARKQEGKLFAALAPPLPPTPSPAAPAPTATSLPASPTPIAPPEPANTAVPTPTAAIPASTEVPSCRPGDQPPAQSGDER